MAVPIPRLNPEPLEQKTTNTNRIGFLLRTASVWQPDQGLISPIGASAFVMGIRRHWRVGGLDPATIGFLQGWIHCLALLS